MATTPNRAYRYPVGSAAPNVPADIGNLAADVDTDVAALLAAWSNYTPTWTATSVNPAIGNGSLNGRYKLIGKTCIATGRILMGSTTTYGTGPWIISLPATAGATIYHAGGLGLRDASVGTNRFGGVAMMNTTTTITFWSGNGASVQNTVPFTWANTDELTWTITYEVA